MILIDDFNYHADVLESLLEGANYLSIEKTRIGNAVPKECNFETLDYEWINVSDWTKIVQNRLIEPIPNPISVNREDGMFLMGGWLHGDLVDTTIPEFQADEEDNLLSELLAGVALYSLINDYDQAYAYLQTWLFLMSRFRSEFRPEMSLQTTQKLIIPYTL